MAWRYEVQSLALQRKGFQVGGAEETWITASRIQHLDEPVGWYSILASYVQSFSVYVLHLTSTNWVLLCFLFASHPLYLHPSQKTLALRIQIPSTARLLKLRPEFCNSSPSHMDTWRQTQESSGMQQPPTVHTCTQGKDGQELNEVCIGTGCRERAWKHCAMPSGQFCWLLASVACCLAERNELAETPFFQLQLMV